MALAFSKANFQRSKAVSSAEFCKGGCGGFGRISPKSAVRFQRENVGRKMRKMNKVALFTKEYPPYVYGGAGVHVEYLSQALAKHIAVEVRCFGDQKSLELILQYTVIPNGRKQKSILTRDTSAPLMRSGAHCGWPNTGSTPMWCTATHGTPTWRVC